MGIYRITVPNIPQVLDAMPRLCLRLSVVLLALSLLGTLSGAATAKREDQGQEGDSGTCEFIFSMFVCEKTRKFDNLR